MTVLAQVQEHVLFGLALTLAAYLAATILWRRCGSVAVLHPVLVATMLVVAALMLLGMTYADYMADAYLLNEALALVVILLAVPLHRQFGQVTAAGPSLSVALLIGCVVAIATALAMPVAKGADPEVLATLAPKSATAAVAVQVAERLGGVAGMTAVIVISTGIFGAVFGPAILRIVGVQDERAAGFALGVASHAIGTARAFQISEVAGVFASVGMVLNALLTIVLVPVVLALLAG